MREHWPKIAIFVGMLIVQIGLAYGLVKYILPPKNIFLTEDFEKPKKVESKTIPEINKSKNTDQDESFEYLESDSIITSRSNVMDDISEYIEEELNEEDFKDAYTFILDELVINPAETRGSKFIVISLTVIASGKDVENKITMKMPAIRDAINTLIARKTVVWLADIDNLPFLREDLKLLLESILKDTKILRVYFTKYLFQ